MLVESKLIELVKGREVTGVIGVGNDSLEVGGNDSGRKWVGGADSGKEFFEVQKIAADSVELIAMIFEVVLKRGSEVHGQEIKWCNFKPDLTELDKFIMVIIITIYY